jgi:hypothetical protein
MMNLWECSHPGCTSKAVGSGSAIGLVAVGWYFVPGGDLYCPAHRPDPQVEENPRYRCDVEGPCSVCTAERDADTLQHVIAGHLRMAERLTASDLADYKKWAKRWTKKVTK